MARSGMRREHAGIGLIMGEPGASGLEARLLKGWDGDYRATRSSRRSAIGLEGYRNKTADEQEDDQQGQPDTEAPADQLLLDRQQRLNRRYGGFVLWD